MRSVLTEKHVEEKPKASCAHRGKQKKNWQNNCSMKWNKESKHDKIEKKF